jgi:orotidine-5'-phosphate decarboxylase/orotate phosphoribosyltransferase
MDKKKVFILAIDGVNSTEIIYDKIVDVLRQPEGLIDFISHIKFNDVFHLQEQDIRSVLTVIEEDFPGTINIFFDFKLADTNGTDVNVLKRYVSYMKFGDIVTVNANCSKRAFNDIRAILPNGVKIAIVSVLTDTSRSKCQTRRGMVPEMAILNDAINLLETLPNPFDAVVCSPAELKFLKKNLPRNIEYIVPGIRDSWMSMGQQSADRANGVKETLDAGADYLVMGSQLMKGNPENGINAIESRQLSMSRALSSKSIHLIPSDPMQTLINLKGFYQSPKDEFGNFKGPLVAYAGTYESEKDLINYVGDIYFNLAVIEDYPQTLNYFAQIMAKKINDFEHDNNVKVSCLVGVPTGGVKIAQEVGRILDIPGICLEKKVIALKTITEKEKFELHFRRNASAISANDMVILFEDLCNNFSTTEKAVVAVQKTGAVVLAIACVANRSKKFSDVWNNLSVISAISVPSDQYRQDDPAVAHLILQGKLSTDPKKDWEDLKKAMENG